MKTQAFKIFAYKHLFVKTVVNIWVVPQMKTNKICFFGVINLCKLRVCSF